MRVIVAVDDNNGLMFNSRRQSQDRAVREKILELCKGSVLRMNEYSKKQFEDTADIIVSNDFMREADKDDYCFVEGTSLIPYADKIDEMIIFHWNRKYPSDMKLEFLPQNNNMTCTESTEFKGYSHDNILMEVWKR